MDPAVWVAFLGLLGVVATAITGIVVAKITNRSEKEQSSETAMERTLRERIILRDEQLKDKDLDILELKVKVEELEAENDRLLLGQRENRAEEKERLDGHN